jgi:hypothetical protein
VGAILTNIPNPDRDVNAPAIPWAMLTPLRIRAYKGIEMSADCPFCKLDPSRIWIATTHALAFPDNFPIAEGHTLVIPIRHVTGARRHRRRAGNGFDV